jgi:hypothetical protein
LNETAVVDVLTASSFLSGPFISLPFMMLRGVFGRGGLVTMTAKPGMLIETPRFARR